MRKYLLSAAAVVAVIAGSTTVMADEASAQKWINQEFQPSSLNKDEQMAEMKWFIDAAKPYAGMEINVLSEGIPTHSYESEVLTKAFAGKPNLREKGRARASCPSRNAWYRCALGRGVVYRATTHATHHSAIEAGTIARLVILWGFLLLGS